MARTPILVSTAWLTRTQIMDYMYFVARTSLTGLHRSTGSHTYGGFHTPLGSHISIGFHFIFGLGIATGLGSSSTWPSWSSTYARGGSVP